MEWLSKQTQSILENANRIAQEAMQEGGGEDIIYYLVGCLKAKIDNLCMEVEIRDKQISSLIHQVSNLESKLHELED